MTIADEQALFQLFEQLLPAERWLELAGESEAQIYTLPVVVWMMLLQRLHERGTQQEAVHQLAAGTLDRLVPDCKRTRERKISQNRGGYARAGGRISLAVMEKVCDELLVELGQRMEPEPEWRVPVLLLDGTSLSLEHTRGLLDDFPPCSNQYGEGHWGILKLVALHDVQTGIAMRPAWGPMYGPQAVSEQQLAEQVLQQAPAGSVILGDGNFGIFFFAWLVVQSQRQPLFRLTKQRAEALGAGKLPVNGEIEIGWRPSRNDRNKHPQLPQDAQILGRLLVVTAKGFRDPLYLFTTLTGDREQIVRLYAKRWHLELDLRTLKRTTRLHHLRGRSRAAIEKELLIAVVAYGLVRACMAMAADRAQLHPRELSFTQCYGLLNAMLAKLLSPVPEQRAQAFHRLIGYMGKSKLPKRSKARSYPRAVWGFTKTFPGRRAQGTEAKSKRH
jgi:hypothetical protein